MKRYDPPMSLLAYIRLSESPVVGDFPSVHRTSSLQTTCDDGSVAIETDVNIGCVVAKELHSTGSCELEDFGF